MERDAIFIRKLGVLEVKINDLEGVAKDSDGNIYVRILHGKDAMRWVTEQDFTEMTEKPMQLTSGEKTNGLFVDYGTKDDDPLRDLIHTFEFTDDEVYQYQVNKRTGLVGKFLVGYRRNTDIMAPDGVRTMKNKHFKGRKR